MQLDFNSMDHSISLLTAALVSSPGSISLGLCCICRYWNGNISTRCRKRDYPHQFLRIRVLAFGMHQKHWRIATKQEMNQYTYFLSDGSLGFQLCDLWFNIKKVRHCVHPFAFTCRIL